LLCALAGAARIATLGEEVRDPERTIPRAIPLALGITVVIYAAVGLTALLAARPRPRGPRRAHPPPGTRGGGGRRGVVGPSGARRRRGRKPRRLARADRRHRPHLVGHGPHRRPTPATLRRSPGAPGARPRRAGGRCCRLPPRAHHRPPRRDRLLVVRRAHLLRDRERLCLNPAARTGP